MIGSIGGGMMEHKLVELAKTRFNTNSNESVYRQQIHDKTTATKIKAGMICSGEQSVFVSIYRKTDVSTDFMTLFNHCKTNQKRNTSDWNHQAFFLEYNSAN